MRSSRQLFVATLAIAALFTSSDRALSDKRQYNALIARHFLQNHQAIPLHNNGNVKSGDVLKLPEQATRVGRTVCYDLGPVKYTKLRSESIQTNLDIAGEVAGSIPVRKLAQIEAELGGRLQTAAQILLEPLSQEEPPRGYQSLESPKAVADCKIIGEIVRGNGGSFVLVTRVFHGKQISELGIGIASTVNISADIKQKKIAEILGGTPSVQLKGSGSALSLEVSKTPDEQSLAFQSAVINVRELARLYARSQANTNYKLEVLVEQYLTGNDPPALTKLRLQIQDALKELGLFFASGSDLYVAVFGGKEALPLEKIRADIPQQHWAFLGTLAAATEIVTASP